MNAPLLLHVFATFATGGPQVRFANVANRFGRRWRHAVLAMDGNLAARERLSPGLDVCFPILPLRRGDTLGSMVRIRAALRAWQPAALVTSNWGSIEWALANALPFRQNLVPHLHMEDGFGPEERARQLPRRVWLRRLALRRATVLVPSTGLCAVAVRDWRLREQRVCLVPNGIDLARFPPPAPRFRAIGPDDIVVGTVAALRPEKNIARLLDAIAACAPFRPRLVVVGDGPERLGLEQHARALDIAERVAFAGHVAEPAPRYAGFDLFVLSSDTEQMPLSVLEAMAAGLPVAATDVGDVREMLAPENRPFVVPRDHAALAAAIRKLAGDPGLRARLGAANRARAERLYGAAGMADAHAALWDGLVAAGTARPSTRAKTSHCPSLVSAQPNRSA